MRLPEFHLPKLFQNTILMSSSNALIRVAQRRGHFLSRKNKWSAKLNLERYGLIYKQCLFFLCSTGFFLSLFYITDIDHVAT